MKRWLTAAGMVCLVTGTSLVVAQTPTGTGQGQTGKPAGQGSGQGTGEKPGSTGTGADRQMAKKGGADAQFVRMAAIDGLAEVAHGQLATQNASAAEVKQFAQRMVDDHGKANDELKALASQNSMTLPTDMGPKHKAMQDKLSKMKGEAFDRAYMAHMVSAHGQAVALFQKQAKGGTNQELKAWAEKTLPTLQEHHKMARDINSKVGGAAKGSGDATKKDPIK